MDLGLARRPIWIAALGSGLSADLAMTCLTEGAFVSLFASELGSGYRPLRRRFGLSLRIIEWALDDEALRLSADRASEWAGRPYGLIATLEDGPLGEAGAMRLKLLLQKLDPAGALVLFYSSANLPLQASAETLTHLNALRGEWLGGVPEGARVSVIGVPQEPDRASAEAWAQLEGAGLSALATFLIAVGPGQVALADRSGAIQLT